MNTILAHLETSRRSFLAELEGLPDEDWLYREMEGQWSIMDVVEHLATVETGVRDVFKGRLFAQPCPPEYKAQTVGKDEAIIQAMQDRSTRRMAPELVKPAGRWPHPAAALAAFDEARTAIINLVTAEKRDLRQFCAHHPSLKALDGYQWLLFLVTHLDRHREQIKDLKKVAKSQRTPPPSPPPAGSR